MNKTIAVENISRSYGAHKAVNDISFSVDEGSIFGFLGPNGAGKSTTIKMLTCQLIPDSGDVYINGLKTTDNEIRIKEKIGVVFEFQNLYEDMTAYDNLDFFRRLYNSPKEKVEEALKTVGMEEHGKKKVKSFSKGMKQKILIARALVNDPDILFLDEPSSGLDPRSAKDIRNQILELKKKGKTIFLTTHNMEEADLLCDRMAILNKGEIVAMDTPAALKKKYGEDSIRFETKTGDFHEAALNSPESVELFTELVSGNSIHTLHSKEATMEEVFLKLTGEEWDDEL